jgi:hypothetical protein
MATFLDSWWKLAQAAGDIAFHAPRVVQQRGALFAKPGTTDWVEATRMVTEKIEAATEAQAALWWHGLTLQQRAWLDFWSASLAGRPPRPLTPAALRRVSRDSAVLAGRALKPVRRRVKANARRLARR